MARTITKSGSKVLDTCPICGKVLTKAGLIGHMAWKHGKDNKAPSLPSKVMPRAEEKRKAQLFDALYVKRLFAENDAVKELEEAVKQGIHRDALVEKVKEVAAHLADIAEISQEEAIENIYRQKKYNLWIEAHPEYKPKPITAEDIKIMFSKP